MGKSGLSEQQTDLLTEIAAVWGKAPSWRFGQLLNYVLEFQLGRGGVNALPIMEDSDLGSAFGLFSEHIEAASTNPE